MPLETQHNPTTTNVGLNYFAPRPKKERSGIGLALSGGGYRAALFHLGALRGLSELGILAQLRTISSVSGGSIVSAHLAEFAVLATQRFCFWLGRAYRQAFS